MVDFSRFRTEAFFHKRLKNLFGRFFLSIFNAPSFQIPAKTEKKRFASKSSSGGLLAFAQNGSGIERKADMVLLL